MNKLIILGRLVRDTEVKTSGETKYGFITVAVDRPKTKKDQEAKTDFIDCVAFGNTIENISKYFHKGDRIALVGFLSSKNMEKDKVKYTAHTMMIEQFFFCESKPTTENKPSNDSESSTSTSSDDSLPFDL